MKKPSTRSTKSNEYTRGSKMKIVLETNVKEDDLFITNRGLIPFKEIEEDYLTIGKYQFKIRRDIESEEPKQEENT